METTYEIKVTDNASHLIDEASELLQLNVNVDLLPEAVQLFFKGGENIRNFISLDSCTAVGTVEIVLQPTDLLFDFLAAIRTGDWNDFVIKHTHDAIS